MFRGQEGFWSIVHAAHIAAKGPRDAKAWEEAFEQSRSLGVQQGLVLRPMAVHNALHDLQGADWTQRRLAAEVLMTAPRVGLRRLDRRRKRNLSGEVLTAVRQHLFHGQDEDVAFCHMLANHGIEPLKGMCVDVSSVPQSQRFKMEAPVVIEPTGKGDVIRAEVEFTTDRLMTGNSDPTFDLAWRVDPQNWSDTSSSFATTCILDDGTGKPLKDCDVAKTAHPRCLTTKHTGDYEGVILHEVVRLMGMSVANDLTVSYESTAMSAKATYELCQSHDQVLVRDSGSIVVTDLGLDGNDKDLGREVRVEKEVVLGPGADPVVAFAIRVLLRAWVTLEAWAAFGGTQGNLTATMEPPEDPKKVLVLGGGPGALAAAYHLSRTESLRQTYDVTVVEASFAPGGKTVSSRDSGGRVIEHGLHMFFGAYENTWDMMRDVWNTYPSSAQPPSGKPLLIKDIDGAFRPRCRFGFAGEGPYADRKTWWIHPPKAPGQPGVPAEDSTETPEDRAEASSLSMASGPMRMFSLMWGLADELAKVGLSLFSTLESSLGPHRHLLDGRNVLGSSHVRRSAQRAVLSRPSVLVPAADDGIEELRAILDALTCLEDQLFPPVEHAMRDALGSWMPFFTVVDSLSAEAPPPITSSGRRYTPWLDLRVRPGTISGLIRAAGSVRNLLRLAQFGVALLIKVLEEEAYLPAADLDPTKPAFYERMNDKSILDLLDDTGFEHLEFPILRAFHSGLFSYKKGDALKPDLAGGVAINAMLRTLFAHKGHMLYQMQSGMGEVVVVPTMKVLASRGVEFQFLHRVDEITADEHGVKEVAVTPFSDDDVVDASNATTWQIVGDTTIETFPETYTAKNDQIWTMHQAAPEPRNPGDTVTWARRGLDPQAIPFDHVIIALPPPVLRSVVADEESQEHLSLKPLLDLSEDDTGVGTIGFQAWLTKTPAELGWPDYPPIIGGLALPIDTWSDMRHLLAMEPPSDAKALNYHVGVRAPPNGNSSQQDVIDEVDHAVSEWLTGKHGTALFGPDVTSFEDHRYVAASSDRADDYTLAAAGTINHRPHPEGWEGVAFAGDWTRNSVACGCVESAVTAGARAARGLILRDGFVTADAPDVAFEWDLVYQRGYTKKVE